MLKQLILVKVIITVIITSSCRRENRNFFDIKYEDVSKVVLHWKEHHYNNTTPDNYILPKNELHSFLKDFNDFHNNSDNPPLSNTCFEIHIYYIDKTIDKYLFDGHNIQCEASKKYYTSNIEENIITKYWGIPKRDFCIKTD